MSARVIGSRSGETRCTGPGVLYAGPAQMVAAQCPAAFWEGFCPNCVVPLAGDPCTWCPVCHVRWSAWPPGEAP